MNTDTLSPLPINEVKASSTTLDAILMKWFPVEIDAWRPYAKQACIEYHTTLLGERDGWSWEWQKLHAELIEVKAKLKDWETGRLIHRHNKVDYNIISIENQELRSALSDSAEALKLFVHDHRPPTTGALCDSCGSWTPNDHPEANDHKDDCKAEAAYFKVLQTRH